MKLTNYSKQSIIHHKRQIATLKQIINKYIADTPIDIKNIKKKNIKIIFDSVFRLRNWYLRLMKLDQVELYQIKVEASEVRLRNAQEERREIGRQLRQVTDKTLELQREIYSLDKQQEPERFLYLIKRETEMLCLESTISRTFQEYVEVEREIFAEYCNAIRTSYEKQKYQSEYAKWVGLLSSGVVFIIGTAWTYGTSKKNRNNLQDLKNKERNLKNNEYSMMSSSISAPIKKIGTVVISAPGYVYGQIKSILPSYDTAISAPKKIYTGVISAPGYFYGQIKSNLPSYDTAISAPKNFYKYCCDRLTWKRK